MSSVLSSTHHDHVPRLSCAPYGDAAVLAARSKAKALRSTTPGKARPSGPNKVCACNTNQAVCMCRLTAPLSPSSLPLPSAGHLHARGGAPEQRGAAGCASEEWGVLSHQAGAHRQRQEGIAPGPISSGGAAAAQRRKGRRGRCGRRGRLRGRIRRSRREGTPRRAPSSTPAAARRRRRRRRVRRPVRRKRHPGLRHRRQPPRAGRRAPCALRARPSARLSAPCPPPSSPACTGVTLD